MTGLDVMMRTGQYTGKSSVDEHSVGGLADAIQGNEEESDAEEDDLAQLQSVEARLLQFDPNFSEGDTMTGRANAKNALIDAFVRGGSELYNPNNLEHQYQLHLNVERIRVPESWFQPGMWGLDSAGLGEVAGWILNSFEEEERRRLMQVRAVHLPGLPLAHYN
jgi:actin-related protein 5